MPIDRLQLIRNITHVRRGRLTLVGACADIALNTLDEFLDSTSTPHHIRGRYTCTAVYDTYCRAGPDMALRATFTVNRTDQGVITLMSSGDGDSLTVILTPDPNDLVATVDMIWHTGFFGWMGESRHLAERITDAAQVLDWDVLEDDIEDELGVIDASILQHYPGARSDAFQSGDYDTFEDLCRAERIGPWAGVPNAVGAVIAGLYARSVDHEEELHDMVYVSGLEHYAVLELDDRWRPLPDVVPDRIRTEVELHSDAPASLVPRALAFLKADWFS